MQGETSTGESSVIEMHKRSITLEDGRYLVFYTFGDHKGTSAATEGGASPGPESIPEPVAEEERRV